VRWPVLLFLVAAVTFVTLIIWYGRTPTKPALPNESETNVVAEPGTLPSVSEPIRHRLEVGVSTRPPEAPSVPGAYIPTPSPHKTKADLMKEGLAALNDEDVLFYGKVVDQFGTPVANANVAGSIQVNNGEREGNDKISLITDANGMFTIGGYKGKALGINVRKAGYLMATTNTRFVYSRLWSEAEQHNPDPNNATVIKMWKLQGAEPLVAIAKECRLPFTGGPLFFDLLTGTVSDRSAGDLQVIITRAPGLLSKRNPGDWSIELKAVNGGIIEADDAAYRVTYQAPMDGYQGNYRVQMNHDDRAWFDNIQRVFFLTSRSGQVYSKFYLDFAINDDPNGSMWFQFKGVANPKSSPNWEGDASPMAMKPQ